MKHPKSYDSTPETRKRMSKVKLKGGKAETLLAKELWHKGYRYRKNDKRLPGSPDIAILKHRIAVFVDGEFWHGKDWETRKERLQRNREYWIEKIEENMTRDQRNDQLLSQAGWIPIHFWEKDVIKNTAECIAEIEETILTRLIEGTEDTTLQEFEEI
ncbi:MAG: very short patch repair endonuclease [Clostridia bacterium]|nr:very short patch repair endonuclease [Clostridia bacterium]